MSPFIERVLLTCGVTMAVSQPARADLPDYHPRPACGPIPGMLDRDRFASLPGPYELDARLPRHPQPDGCESPAPTWRPTSHDPRVAELLELDPAPPIVPASIQSPLDLESSHVGDEERGFDPLPP